MRGFALPSIRLPDHRACVYGFTRSTGAFTRILRFVVDQCQTLRPLEGGAATNNIDGSTYTISPAYLASPRLLAADEPPPPRARPCRGRKLRKVRLYVSSSFLFFFFFERRLWPLQKFI
jgi:hypothetical protein